MAFEHHDTQYLHTDITSLQNYHYQWAHEQPLGPAYHGRFDKHSHYGGKEYTPHQIALARALGLKWAFKTPYNNGSAEYGRLAPTQIKAQVNLENGTLDGLMRDLKELLKMEDNWEKYFITMVKEGLCLGP